MSSSRPLYYFDHNATTRVAPEVIEAMLPFFREHWGNPSSAYQFGHRVARHVEEARTRVAELIHAEPKEIVFTGCGTESNNAALQSALMTQPGKRHVVTTAVEHSANIKFGETLRRRGYDVTFLPVEADGSIDLHVLDQAIRPDTAIVSVMWANNETGVLFPIEEIAAICQSRGILFHTDAVQAAGKVKIDVKATGVDLLSLSAHKLYAPKGVGALFVKRGTPFQAYIVGGHQEHGRRAGTENVPYLVGFGRAAELAAAKLPAESRRLHTLRDRMEKTLLHSIPHSARNGGKEPRLPNTANLAFDGVEAVAVLKRLDHLGICVSSGSACTTGSTEPSHVLVAMGVKPSLARGSVRLSLGLDTADAEVDYLLEQLPPVIAQLRKEAHAAPAATASDDAPHSAKRATPARAQALSR